MRRLALSLTLLLFCGAVAAEQVAPSKTAATTVPPKPVPKPAPKKPAPKSPIARDLFGAASAPAPLAARAIGSYAKGCLAGGVSLPINGPDWQVMRLSRNRNWGTPQLLDFLERLSSDARAFDGWPGLLIGDMEHYLSGEAVTEGEQAGSESSAGGEFYAPEDEETVKTIKELLETRVRPAVAQDGGDITFQGYREGVVYLHMRGACSGCPSSTATLRHGIENLLRHFIPEVQEVRPV